MGDGALRLSRLADRSNHVQRTLCIVLELVHKNPFAAIEGILEADELPLDSAELFRGEKRLGQKPFQTPGARDRLAVLRGKLLQAKHGDDVLEILVLGEGATNAL